jgi:hypothetical protein
VNDGGVDGAKKDSFCPADPLGGFDFTQGVKVLMVPHVKYLKFLRFLVVVASFCGNQI